MAVRRPARRRGKTVASCGRAAPREHVIAGSCRVQSPASVTTPASIDRSQHIYIGELNERFRDVDPSKHYTLMCASGMRATVAAGWPCKPWLRKDGRLSQVPGFLEGGRSEERRLGKEWGSTGK